MVDKFDPYREALVMEEETVWPAGLEPADERRKKVERALHDNPAQAQLLEYVRTHTGFMRRITVTDDDLARVK